MMDDDIRWPTGYSPAESPVHVVNHIDIAAPPSVAWGHLVRAADWPAWYANASNVRLADGGHNLTAGARFRWQTFGVGLDTVVREWVKNERIAWLATSLGVRAYHAWLIVPSDVGCRVITEETQHGIVARAGSAIFPSRMHNWHQKWLEGLKTLAEG